MNQYPVLKNLLVSIMSVDVGLSQEREEAALVASLENGEYRQKIRHELEAAFLDEDFSWMNLLDNENYCVFPADSEEEAKEYVKARLWNRIVAMES